MRLPPGMNRTKKLRFELCQPWGFLVAKYLPPHPTGLG